MFFSIKIEINRASLIIAGNLESVRVPSNNCFFLLVLVLMNWKHYKYFIGKVPGEKINYLKKLGHYQDCPQLSKTADFLVHLCWSLRERIFN